MTLLHAHFNLRNQQAFLRLLDGGSDRGQSAGLSSSGGKSWNRQSALTMAMSCDVNARDWLGRTVLHLACSSTERSGVEYVRRLLAHPAINVNIYDVENRWTALHRALYHGNIAAAILLLQRSDIDTSLKDLEGYTAFDLYNSTVEGTKPSSIDEGRAEIYTWGANRNAALGLGDSDDRVYPEQVVIHQQDDLADPERRTLSARFLPIEIRLIAMSRLHTVLVTSENHGNIHVCGFGSGGRLGPGQHTQYKFKRLHQFTHTIVSVALGQDHTLALTSSGEVLSWGLNRFSQLGYVVEASSPGSGRLEEPIQSTPRKVFGPLRKEFVRGVAACKTASACWTDREVYTFGTNNGQLGYDNPVQLVPRKVTKITQPTIAISISDSAMVCLLGTQEVMCIWKDRHFKIGFPSHAFPSEIQVYRPPQAVKDAHICKITNCDDTFAALSSNGEVFSFTVPNPDSDNVSAKDKAGIKPQCVWALRKQFSAVKDVALGSDGSIIICTESGHVFVRSRNVKTGQGNSGKAFRFQRVPFIQRITNVCANNTGAFGVLRMDYQPKAISTHGTTICQDLAEIQPYLGISAAEGHQGEAESFSQKYLCHDSALPSNQEVEDPVIQKDIEHIERLCNFLMASRRGPNKKGLFEGSPLPLGANLIVQTQSGTVFPVHRVLLAVRSSVLYDILSGSKVIQDQDSKISLRLLQPTPALPRLVFAGCHVMSVLILLTYLYSDELPAIWDRRVAIALEQQLRLCKVRPSQVKLELEILARILDLPFLAQTLQSPGIHDPPPSLVRDLDHLFHGARTRYTAASPNIREGLGMSPLAPDVILQLADKDVVCYSVVLRARSVFFSSFFDDPDWTVKRWKADGTIDVNMKHLKWRAMQFVLRFLCCGGGEEMFDTLDFVNSLDEVLEFMFDVMAAANELLLDRLVMICSAVILKYSNITNSCYVLADATHFRCEPLMESLQDYMSVNMEALLESRMLEDMAPDLIRQLSDFVRRKQADKSPVSRSNRLVDAAMRHHADWLALQDIPQPIVRTNRTGYQKHSPKLSPTTSNRKVSLRPSGNNSLSNSPLIRAQPSSPADDIFAMDDTDSFPTLNLDPPSATVNIEAVSKPVPAWRGASSVPRVDMKTIMAEVASNTRDGVQPLPIVPMSDFTIPERAPIKSNQRITRRDGRKESWPAAVEVPEGTGTAVPPRSPAWNWPKPQLSANSISPSPSPMRSLENARAVSMTPSKMPSEGTPAKPQPTSSPQPRTQTGLGPVFTPSRQPSKSDTFRSSSKAWTLPPVQPIVEPSPHGPGISFVAIQQLQLEQLVDPGRDKQSLLQIQEEEQARQAEADFLKWWSAEEARVRAEEHALPQHPASHNRRPKKYNNHNSSRAKDQSHQGQVPSGTRKSA